MTGRNDPAVSEYIDNDPKAASSPISLIRLFGCLSWLAGLALLAGLLGGAVLRFILPEPYQLQVGKTQDFPIGGNPRLFWQGSTPFYVLNVDGELLALIARSSRGNRCLIRWEAERELFIDPCYGSRMSMVGQYQGGGPPLEMVRLSLQVVDDQVWVEIGYR